MGNIFGRAVNLGGGPLPGLDVRLFQMNVEFGVVPVLHTTTTATGEFSMPTPGFGLTFAGGNMWPFELRITNSVSRVLFRSKPKTLSVLGADWPVGDIKIPSNTLTGWRITNLDPNGTQRFYSEKNLLTPLVENDVAWKELETAVKASRGF